MSSIYSAFCCLLLYHHTYGIAITIFLLFYTIPRGVRFEESCPLYYFLITKDLLIPCHSLNKPTHLFFLSPLPS